MRIISDFHDYYDIGMQNGIDPQLPYRRFRREEDMSYLHGRLWNLHYPALYDDYCIDKNRMVFFGFAGKIYPAFAHVGDSNEMTYIFSLDKIDPKFFDDAVRRMLDCGRAESRKRAENHCLELFTRDLKEMFAMKNDNRLLSLFAEFQTAIFVWWLESQTIIINECLNLYGFQKVLPPIQAFQELAMYVGAYLTKPIIEEPPISDKIKAEIHGFDKFSFRKEKRR